MVYCITEQKIQKWNENQEKNEWMNECSYKWTNGNKTHITDDSVWFYSAQCLNGSEIESERKKNNNNREIKKNLKEIESKRVRARDIRI